MNIVIFDKCYPAFNLSLFCHRHHHDDDDDEMNTLILSKIDDFDDFEPNVKSSTIMEIDNNMKLLHVSRKVLNTKRKPIKIVSTRQYMDKTIHEVLNTDLKQMMLLILNSSSETKKVAEIYIILNETKYKVQCFPILGKNSVPILFIVIFIPYKNIQIITNCSFVIDKSS